MPRPPARDYFHLNKKKIVVVAVLALLVLLLTALLALASTGVRLVA